MMSREIRLKNRPVGLPGENDFEVAETNIAEIIDGQVLIRNIYMSVDPYMRGRMYDRKSYAPPFQIGQPLEGGCVGQVINSKNDKFAVGECVMHMLGWREHTVSDGRGLTKIDPHLFPIQTYLGTAGMPGMTAYVGLLDIGRPQAGETVFVSAASGAVGSIACQIAKLKGCRVVGSAGSDEKVSWLKEEAGIDAAFNYKNVDHLITEVGRHCPQGVDVYFENVGGEHLVAALEHMNPFGRLVMCGMISNYNATEPVPGPPNLGHTISKKLTMQGFIVGDHMRRLPDFHADMATWVADGKIKWRETVLEGIENAPAAFIGLFKGQNFGKMLVKLGADPEL
ncbi:MAG: NADP-dependent oxidoreductase [Deltaproteobacteria bacterium]|nr:NADP-dependent oxidoreductase [Deltaproteobacteria bacterium]